jgi:tRNA-binding EMAP/Myf-like protein
MSSLIVKVCEVYRIEKHPNADKLSIVTVDNEAGWSCIVGLDQYLPGDKIVYVPPDCIVPEKLIEELNLDYLKKNGRTSAIRLRGYVSQGLILNLPPGNWTVGDDVADVFGITKYEQPDRPTAQTRGKTPRKNRLNPFFDKYTDIENVKNFGTVFTEDDDVVVSEKIHGCLNKKTQITLADGTKTSIGDIVEKRLNVSVLGVDASGNLCNSKIIGWFNNGISKDDKWVKVKYNRRGFGTTGNYFGSLICTDSHQIYDPVNNIYVSASNLKIGQKVLMLKSVGELGFVQKHILIGKMIGDGSIHFLGEGGAQFNFAQKADNHFYLQHTMECLGDIAGNRQRDYVSGYGTSMIRYNTISSPAIFNEFNKWFDENGKKIIPKDVDINPISLAFLYMDDGSLSHSELQEDRACIALCDFDEASVENLVQSIKTKMGISAVKYMSDGWRIRFNANDARKMFILMMPYITADMQYKLPIEFRTGNAIYLNENMASKYNMLIEREVIGIEDSLPTKVSKAKYDIETETHNFFANEILVHNSNWRASNLPLSYSSQLPFVDKLKYFWNRYIKHQSYEFVYGSHNVQLTSSSKHSTYYGEDIYGKVAEKYVLSDKIPKDTIIYGEVYGKGVQDLAYGLDDIDLVVFDIKQNGKYLNWEDTVNLATSLGLPVVPVIYVGKYDPTKLAEWTNRKSSIYPTQIAEGCVIKMLEESNDPRIGRKILKSISPDYLTRKGGTEFK